MSRTTVKGDGFHFQGTLSADTMTVSNSAVTNAAVASNAAIDAEKIEQQYLQTHNQRGSVAAATEEIHLGRAAGEVVKINYRIRTAPSGSDSYTIAVKKNSSNILTGTTIGVTSATLTATVIDAPFTATTTTLDDAIVVVVASGSGSSWGTGLVVTAVMREGAGS